MKKLALVLLALPLAACATAVPQEGTQVEYTPTNSLIPHSYSLSLLPKSAVPLVSEAEAYCRGGNIGPANPQYGQCVNDYLQNEYGIEVFRDAKGSLQMAHYHPYQLPDGFVSQ